jgi:hypothetical protein
MIQLKQGTTLHTNGRGLWSSTVADVEIVKLVVPYIDKDETWGELRVYFNTDTWNVEDNSLIYSDPHFEVNLFDFLQLGLHFSGKAAGSVMYSEQGMQGNDFVSFDVKKAFIDEWLAIPGNNDHL